MPFLVGSLAGGNIIAMGLRLVAGLLIGRLVIPETLGLFNGIGLVLGYVPFLQLGVLSGLNRELPYFIGKGDRGRANELAAAAQAWALLLGGLVFVSLLGVCVWELAHGQWWKAAGWFTNALLALALFYNTNYLQNTYRTSHDFARLALVGVAESAVGLALLALVAVLNFYGLCLRAILATVVSTVLLFYWRPIRVGPRWDVRHLKHLFVIGAPIFAVGQLYTWWVVINSTLVLRFAGTEGMGLYAMVILAGSALELLPQAVAQVLYPRMAEQYGRIERIRSLIRIARTPIAVSAAGLVPVIVAAWWLVGPAMRLLIPDYANAVPAMQWALLVPFVTCFQPMNSVFNVARKQHLYAAAILLGMAAYAGSLAFLIRETVSLTAFPQAMLIGRGFYMVVCYFFIWRLRRNEQAHDVSDT